MEVQAGLKVQLFRKYLYYKTGINLAELLSNRQAMTQYTGVILYMCRLGVLFAKYVYKTDVWNSYW